VVGLLEVNEALAQALYVFCEDDAAMISSRGKASMDGPKRNREGRKAFQRMMALSIGICRSTAQACLCRAKEKGIADERRVISSPTPVGRARPGPTRANWSGDVSEVGRCEVMECPYSMELQWTVLLILATGIPSG
jgi:hypothetical protein